MKSSRAQSVENALAALLDALAVVLIPLEVTPARLEQIARASFVKAGARSAKKRSSGRLHFARIAALTGLSRAEVKRIVAANFEFGKPDLDNLPRALRVLSGWRKSKAYSSRGRPRTLAIMGRAPSFESLCRDYSGDIPPRVILGELERSTYVIFNHDRTRVAVSRSPRSRSRASPGEVALMFAANFLAEALHEDHVLVRKRQRAYISTTAHGMYAERAIAGRVTELLDQIPNMFPTSKERQQGVVDVFALVSRKPQT
jgi:hypothetical protein